jgi:hypothetical protein
MFYLRALIQNKKNPGHIGPHCIVEEAVLHAFDGFSVSSRAGPLISAYISKKSPLLLKLFFVVNALHGFYQPPAPIVLDNRGFPPSNEGGIKGGSICE